MDEGLRELNLNIYKATCYDCCNPKQGEKTTTFKFLLEYLVPNNMKNRDESQCLDKLAKQDLYIVKESVLWESEYVGDI